MEIVWMLIVFAFFLALIMLRLEAIKDRDYFEKQGVMYLGNRSYAMAYQALRGTTVQENILEWYNLMVKKGQSVAGSKEFGAKVVTINDPDIMRSIFVKDFDHFVDRREFDMPEEEILFGKMLFALRGKAWKDLRSNMTPAFTSGKIKRLYRLFEKSAELMVTFLEKDTKKANHGIGSGQQKPVEVDFVKAIGKFTIEIISTAVCGINSKTFESNEPSMMELMSRRMEMEFGTLQTFKILLVMLFPIVANFFKMSFFDKEAEAYFMWAIKQTIKNREENPDKNWDDFIQLMIEGRKGTLKKDDDDGNEIGGSHATSTLPEGGKEEKDSEKSLEFMDDNHIVANCVLFILAGFDTTQGALLFGLYSMALNPEMQDRLREEIERGIEEDGNLKDGEFMSYETLHKLKYLDMVVSETLRLYPSTVMVDRGCTKDYQITKNYMLKKGQGVLIPILGFHRDERFYPNPLKFDPERFSEENKSKILPYTYMPFGGGPRSCIGHRFALTEAKLGIAISIYHFKLEPSANTPIPMIYKNGNMLKPKNGLKLNITKIPRQKAVPKNVPF